MKIRRRREGQLAKRLRFRAKLAPSSLEAKFTLLWRAARGPELVPEFKFHETRRWRADFAHLESRSLIEIEGGIYVNGRHNRAAGFNADLEKYLEACLAGWRLYRLSDEQINVQNVKRLIAALRGDFASVAVACGSATET